MRATVMYGAHDVRVESVADAQLVEPTGRVPYGEDQQAMNPASGPATPAEGRVRLETAHQQFAEACR